MSTEWIHLKRKNWPDGSKKRALDALGASSLFEAVERVKSPKDVTAPQVTSNYKALRKAVDVITLALEGIDIDNVDQRERMRLRDLPLTNTEDVALWRDGWLKLAKDSRATQNEKK